MCFVGYIMWSFVAASAYNLMMLTLERHYAITKPMQYDQEKVFKRLPLILFLSWFIGFVTAGPIIAIQTVVGRQCLFTMGMTHPELFDLMSPYYIVVEILIPAVVMVAAYVQMGLALKKSGFSSKVNSQAQKNLFYTCLILVLVFVFTGINHVVTLVLVMTNYYPHNLNIQTQVSSTLIFLNSMLNPFVYSVRYKEFQNRVKEMFGVFQPKKTSSDNVQPARKNNANDD